MNLGVLRVLEQLRRSGRRYLSRSGIGMRGLLLVTLLLIPARDSKLSNLFAWSGVAAEETASETEQPEDSQEPSKGGDEVVPPRQRGDRMAGRSTPLPFLLPRTIAANRAVIAPLPLMKLLPGGRHADRNGLGVPLRC